MNREDDIHQRVMEAVEASQEAVWRIARQLNREHHVTVNSARLAPSRAVAADYADCGDLILHCPIDIKHLTDRNKAAYFTCRDDWAHGNRFIVCAKRSHDKAWPVPTRYIIVNWPMTHVAVVRVSNFADWTVWRDRDWISGEPKDYYLSPIEQVRFCPIEELT
jgi:hypothetical protein